MAGDVEWQFHRKLGTLAELALDGDAAAVSLCDGAHDSEAEAEASLTAPWPAALEPLEDGRLVFSRDAAPGIGVHWNTGAVSVITVRLPG